MKFYSSAHRSPIVDLKEAIIRSEAPDGGLYMPETVRRLPQAFFNNLSEMSVVEISYFVANTLFGPEIPADVIKRVSEETFVFDMPLICLDQNIYSFELFHGPTHSVKDIGTRFLARLLVAVHGKTDAKLHLLLATSGNGGNAITHGFHGVEGVEVYVLYPRSTPSALSSQFSQMGGNIHAVRVNGTIDDCRSLVAAALADPKLNENVRFTSANSANIGRVLPQVICYFQAYAKFKARNPKCDSVWFSVPCGNAGNLYAAHIARQMGLPIERIIAACNANASMVKYLERGQLDPDAATVRTLAYALDNAHPANIPRFDEICGGDVSRLRSYMSAAACDDAALTQTIRDIYQKYNYMMGPHSAISYYCLRQSLPQDKAGIFLATAHPSRSADSVKIILGDKVSLLHEFTKREIVGKNKETFLAPTYPALRKYLMQSADQ